VHSIAVFMDRMCYMFTELHNRHSIMFNLYDLTFFMPVLSVLWAAKWAAFYF